MERNELIENSFTYLFSHVWIEFLKKIWYSVILNVDESRSNWMIIMSCFRALQIFVHQKKNSCSCETFYLLKSFSWISFHPERSYLIQTSIDLRLLLTIVVTIQLETLNTLSHNIKVGATFHENDCFNWHAQASYVIVVGFHVVVVANLISLKVNLDLTFIKVWNSECKRIQSNN